MHLLDDAFYLFSFALKLAAGQTFILHFRVKQVDDCFVVKASGKEWRFQQDKQETLEELFVCIFEELKEYLETDFEKFIQGKRNTIGFQIP
jgi:hypothetical protein